MINRNEPYILVFGASVYDIFGFTYKSYRCKDSNPGSVKVSFGGVCRNIAENMARININTKLISTLGNDEKGKSILKYAESINLDMSESIILEGESTPTYMAILNEEGEMESAVVDMNITDKLTTEFVDSKDDIIRKSEYIVVDCDNPSILEYMIAKYNGSTRFILDPVSASKVKHVKHLIGNFHTIKPNRHEAEVLCGFDIKDNDDVRKAGKYFLGLGVKNVFISLDAEGIYYNDGNEEGFVKTHDVSVVNVTGAGDSCVAGICYGYMNELNVTDTLKYAIAMSAITISHKDTIHPQMGCELVEEYLNKLRFSEIKCN